MFIRISDDIVINAENIQCIRADSPVPDLPERAVIEYYGPHNILHAMEIPHDRAQAIINAIYERAL